MLKKNKFSEEKNKLSRKKKRPPEEKNKKTSWKKSFNLAAHFNIFITFQSTAEVARTEQGDPLRGVQFSMIFFS